MKKKGWSCTGFSAPGSGFGSNAFSVFSQASTGNSDALTSLDSFHASESLLYQQFQQLLQPDQVQGETFTLLPVTGGHVGPAKPRYGIPREEWPMVVRRVVENQEPLRRVAGEYQVSYETIRRIVRTVQKQEEAV